MSWGADNGKGADVLRWIRSLYANRQVIVSSMQLAGGVNIRRDPHALAPAVYSCLHPLHACLFSKNPTIVGEVKDN